MIQELSDPEFTFSDISKPLDAYRLFTMLRLQGAPALYESVDALIETHASEVFDTVLREDYQSWKEPERILGGLYNRANPAESNRRIESWRKGVPKP